MAAGRFIALEGIDGSGTTTLASGLASRLRARGVPVHVTREPSDGPVGVLLRQALSGRLVLRSASDAPASPLPPPVMALLFAADRLDHLEAEILPLVAQGVTVLTDRYFHSSLAYQSLGAERDWILALNRRARPPDLTLVLDLPAEVAAERRAREAGRATEIFDALEAQRRIAENYRALVRDLAPQRIALVDARPSAEEVLARALTILDGEG